MNAVDTTLYRFSRWFLRAGMAFYFARIERFHKANVPRTGPVLFTSNHPNSVADAFVIGCTAGRKVHFVATIQLFRWRILARLLSACGVIPVNRVKDNPRAMRSVMDTFEACYRVLEKGEAIGIFPEGITHDSPQLKAIKTGAARMALELEDRHAGKLGLKIVPVGLTFSAKDRYRSDALANFGNPIDVAEFLPQYRSNRHAAIHTLSARIEHDIQQLIYHLPDLERARIIEAVKRLYLDHLRENNTVLTEPVTPVAGELVLTQAIVKGVNLVFARHPQVAAEFTRKLDRYDRVLSRLRIRDQLVAEGPRRGRLLARTAAIAGLTLLGAPIALYGWIHRCLPYALLRVIVKRTAKQPVDRTHVATATIVSGTILFSAFYALCVLLFSRFFSLHTTVWYALTLPAASLFAHYYLAALDDLWLHVRALPLLLRGPSAIRRLTAQRSELLSMIASEREDLLASQAILKQS